MTSAADFYTTHFVDTNLIVFIDTDRVIVDTNPPPKVLKSHVAFEHNVTDIHRCTDAKRAIVENFVPTHNDDR